MYLERTISVICLVALVLASGCTLTDKASSYNDLPGPDGSQVSHVNTTQIALHFLFSKPLWGNGSLDACMDAATAAAKADGAKKVRVVQSSESAYWWIFPPFSLIIQPVVSNVALDAIK